LSSRKKITIILLSAYLIVFNACAFSYAAETSNKAKSLSASGSTLVIVSPAWKNFTEADGSGFYFELMRLIYEPLDIAIEYKITPWARGLIMLDHQQADAMLGAYLAEPEKYHFPKKPIWLDVSAAVFKRDKFKWRGLASLKNKDVGWIRGYSYDAYIDVEMSKKELIDNRQAWELLRLDRIDFYIDSLTDLTLYMKDQGLSSKRYALETVLVKPMYVKFAHTDKGKRFADIYDQRIVELHQNEQLKQLYIKWAYDTDQYPAFVDALQSPPIPSD
jgi:polar amino acid transport system substrate-binding protein